MDYKVLIIDDDIWMQRILSKTLQSYGFNEIYLASNGFEGIALAVEEIPHLIILDILMPELSGLLTLKVIKTIKRTKDIPVLMVSAMSDTENLGLSIKSGAAGFISKPFTRSTIYEKLVQIFGKYNMDRIAKGEEMVDIYPEEPDLYKELRPEEISEDEIELMKAFGASTSSAIDLNELEKEFATKFQDKYSIAQKQEDDKKNIETIKKLLLKAKAKK